jgi:hypothetical protein
MIELEKQNSTNWTLLGISLTVLENILEKFGLHNLRGQHNMFLIHLPNPEN